MNKGKRAKKVQISIGGIVYWTAGILLTLTMLSTWMAGGLLAKYVVSYSHHESADVASSGVEAFELWEHKANEFPGDNCGEYRLDLNTEVTGNAYNKVLPGVDIPKDPFIRLVLSGAEVDYTLYIKVTRSDPFPDKVE